MMIFDIEPQILCSGSLFKEKCITNAKNFKKAFKVIFGWIPRVGRWLKNKYLVWWRKLYYNYISKHIDKIKKKIRKVFLISNLVVTGIIVVLFLINFFVGLAGHGQILGNIPFIVLWISVGSVLLEIGFYIAFSYFFRWYDKVHGQERLHEQDREYTYQYVIQYGPKIAKTHGYTGAGKDEENSGLTTMQIEGFKAEIAQKKEEIKTICYIFDFAKLDQLLPSCLNLFYSSSETITKTNFMTLCECNHFFIKKVYYKKIKIDEFKEDAKRLKKNVLYTSDYIYDEGGINKKHFLNMLYDYVMLSVREYENRFLISNQPHIEDMERGQTAVVFSLNYLTLKKQPDKIINEKDTMGKSVGVPYKEKVEFIIKDYMGISETEVATYYLNLDRQIMSMIQSRGLREAKAYNRHIWPHFFWYQTDQAPERVSKLFRELDHYYIYPDTRLVVQGGEALNIPLKKELNKIQNKIAKITTKHDARINKNTKIDQKVERIGRYWVASSRRRYKNKIDALNDKRKYFNFDEATKKLNERASELKREIALNIYNHSYIDKIVTIGREPAHNSGRPVYTPKQILDNPDLIKTTYSVKMTFKLSDCWRYNTHYKANVGKNRADASELNLIDAETWSLDLELHDEHAIRMGYMQETELMGIDPNEIIKSGYKKKENLPR